MPILMLCIAFGFVSFPAFSYMGPGAGLTAFGCLVALLAGIWYTCKGFLWLPLKRKFGKQSLQSESLPQNEKAPQAAQADSAAKTEQSEAPADKTV